MTTWTSRALAVAAFTLGAAAPAAHAVTAVSTDLQTQAIAVVQDTQYYALTPHPTESSPGAPASMATTTTVALSVFSSSGGDMGSLQTHSEGTATTTSAAPVCTSATSPLA